MSKSIAKTIAVTFIVFVVFIFAINCNNVKAKNNEETTKWKVTFTNEGKDLKETKEVIFKNIDNEYVVSDKIAPGSRMRAEVEINIEKTDTPVEINAEIDDTDLENTFTITKKIDNEVINNNQPVIANQGEKKILVIEIEWVENGSNDMMLLQKNELSIPIKIEIYSHI